MESQLNFVPTQNESLENTQDQTVLKPELSYDGSNMLSEHPSAAIWRAIERSRQTGDDRTAEEIAREYIAKNTRLRLPV